MYHSLKKLYGYCKHSLSSRPVVPIADNSLFKLGIATSYLHSDSHLPTKHAQLLVYSEQRRYWSRKPCLPRNIHDLHIFESTKLTEMLNGLAPRRNTAIRRTTLWGPKYSTQDAE